jgi:hypothetical protein
MKYLLYILFLVISIKVNAQLFYLAHPYKIYSENGEYFIKSIPFSDQIWTKDGKTNVYLTKDSSKAIYTINRYFEPDLLYLSNDGNSVCYVNDAYYEKDLVTFYSSSNLIKKYSTSLFIDTSLTSNNKTILYHNDDIDSIVIIEGVSYNNYGYKSGTDSISKYLNTLSSFIKSDTLYLLTQNKFVNKFNIKTGELIEKISIKDYIKSKLIYPQNRIVQNYNIKIPTQFGLPKLITGENYYDALAAEMKMVSCENFNETCNDQYKTYSIYVYCGIDSTGKCIDLQLERCDSILIDGTKKFFKNATFDKTQIPKGIEKWYFRHGASFRKESIEIAKKERDLEKRKEEFEYEVRIISDSINGVYIPFDIYDCFKQLDLTLKPNDKIEFKNYAEYEVIPNYHMGLGLWIRNNWGLWIGSRLSYYFNTLGVFEPDNMSGIVLISYHRWMNNKDIEFDKQINQHQEYNKIKPRKKYNK